MITDKQSQFLHAESGIRFGYDVQHVRKDFPLLRQSVHGKPLVYLDNAATTQKPQSVIDAATKYYVSQNANIHRGVHFLSELATYEYEKARGKAKLFLNASDSREIIFVRGATEGINLVKDTFGRSTVKEGDEILISAMEHHSNIVPWQLLCEDTGAKLRIIPMNDAGELLFDEYEKLLTPKTKIVGLVYLSNSLGTINPVKKMIETAHRQGIPVLIDGAQATSHLRIDVRDLDCDFYVFSGHKVFAPTGIGVLYGKASILESMPPYQAGGDMISSVTFEKTVYNGLPYKYEAGTPNIEGAIGLGAALDYIQSIGLDAIAAYEHSLVSTATAKLSAIKGLRIIGTAESKASVISFIMDSIHAHDIGTILDREGIAVRTGHHCTQPVMKRFGIPATARASFAFYNTFDEIDILVQALGRVKEIFGNE